MEINYRTYSTSFLTFFMNFNLSCLARIKITNIFDNSKVKRCKPISQPGGAAHMLNAALTHLRSAACMQNTAATYLSGAAHMLNTARIDL